MSIISVEQLKAKFEGGDYPGSADYINLIDTLASLPESGAGSTILSGSGAPSNGTGSNGDFYINSTNYDIYGPKTAGAWGSATSLIGPTGATGSAGATGAAGTTGATGATDSGASGSSTTSVWFFNGSAGTDFNRRNYGTIFLPRYTDTARQYFDVTGYGSADSTNTNWGPYWVGGVYNASAAITSITFIRNNGSFGGGNVYIYGEK